MEADNSHVFDQITVRVIFQKPMNLLASISNLSLSLSLSLSYLILFYYMYLFVIFPGELHWWILQREAGVHDKDVLQAWQALASWVPAAVVETSLVFALSLRHHSLSAIVGNPVIVITSDRDHHWLAPYNDSIYSLWMRWLIGKWILFGGYQVSKIT